MTQALKGVWAAAVTPFNADLSIDVGALKAHVDWLLANGCDGAALAGTTGEGPSLGVNERLDLLAQIAGAWPAERIMIGVGQSAIPDTVALIEGALDHGYPNLLMLPPWYFKQVADEGLFRSVAEIVARLGAAAADARIHVYDFPQMVGFALDAGLIARLKAAWPETLVGMKDSSGDFDKMTSVLDRVADFNVYAGTEALLLPIWQKGGAGCISATVNVTCRAAGRVWAAICDGDETGAAAAQKALTAQRLALQQWPMVPAMKAILAQRFPERMGAALRPPLLALSDTERERLLQELDEIVPENG